MLQTQHAIINTSTPTSITQPRKAIYACWIMLCYHALKNWITSADYSWLTNNIINIYRIFYGQAFTGCFQILIAILILVLSFVLYQISLAMQGESKDRQAVKVKFLFRGKQMNKLVCHHNLNYPQFAQKLCQLLDIQTQQYYHLSYLDESKEEITINDESDYQLFVSQLKVKILYLKDTSDGDIDFRNFLDKNPSETEEVYQLKKRLRQREQQIARIRDLHAQQIDNLRSKFEPIEVHQQLLFQNNQRPSKQHPALQERIQNARAQLKRQFQEFKKQHLAKTLNKIKQQICILKQKLKGKSRAGIFQHQFGCQNPSNCKHQRKIIGLRLKCLVCSTNFCQDCADEKHRGGSFTHQPTHPMVKYRNSQWDEKLIEMRDKIQMTEEGKGGGTGSLERKREGEIQAKITHLALMLEITETEARKIVFKYPKLSEEELVNVTFDQLKR